MQRNRIQNNTALMLEGSPINHWNDLSIQEKAAMMDVAIKNGITDLKDIRDKYNEFAEGGDIYPFEEVNEFGGGGYIYDVLPGMLKKAGLDIRVSSGYRPAGKVGTSGKRSWHWRHGAVDIVPQGKTTFEDIEKVVSTNPEIIQYMTANGFGYLDETNRTPEGRALMKKTGATGNHFHFGKDTRARERYQSILSRGNVATLPAPATSEVIAPTVSYNVPTVEQPPVPAFMPSNPQAFFNPIASYTPSEVVAPIETESPLATYDPEELKKREQAQYRNNFTTMMSLLYPQDNSMGLLSMLTNNTYSKGGSINIKPSHRGRLTELKERTGKSEAELYNDGNPAHKKMVVFARNARKWKHGDGGNLFDDGGSTDGEERPPIVPFRQREEVVITPDYEYNQYLNTLPDNQRFTPNDKYDSYLYWKLNGKPKNFKEAYDRGMFTYDHSDNSYHANSIAWDDNTGIGHFMKPKDHPTVKYETDWFNKGLTTEEGGWQRPETFLEWKDSQEFRNNYDLLDDPNRPNFYKYQPKKKSLGGNLFDDGGNKDNIFKYTNSNGNVRYVYQNNPDAEEVPVRPLNTIFPDPAQWTFTDDAGKFYTPRRTTPTNTAELNPDNRTGFERALDNYIGEAFNTVPKGYHTLPAIGAAAFGLATPALGEAALTSGFGAHGLSKWMNGEIHSPLDAAMTALEIAPLGQLAKPALSTLTPIIENEGFALANPITGNINWVGRGIGSHIDVSPTTDGWLGVDYINSTRSGVGRKLYDAAIKEAHKRGLNGVKSGVSLASAPKTYNIWNHYPNRTLLSTTGSHGNGNMINGEFTTKVNTPEELIEATTQGIDAAVIGKAPVYGLTTPSNNVPFLSFSRTPKASQITAENAASITPEQWTAAQDAAIARGDMAEVQRLRDLHFKVSAPDTKVLDINGVPQLVIHKTPNDFTVFDNSRSIGNLNWAATPRAFEGENGVFATGAGINPKEMRLYVNMKNPHYPTIEEGMEPAFINEGEDGILGIVDKDMTDFYKSASDAGEGFNMSLGVDNPYALKSADAVTYDDKGVRIPLGLRDNFKINDIRYGLLPFLGLGAAGTLYGKQE